MPKSNRFGQAETLNNQELEKIRRYLVIPSHRLLWDIAKFTGERWGAICQLKIGDVWNRDGSVKSSITYRKETRKGKQDTRQCPTHPVLKDLLSGKMPKDKSPDDYLFESRKKRGCHLTFNACDKFLRIAVAKAGLTHRGISTHTTRRSFITALHSHGVDIRTLQDLTGHRDLKNLQRYIDVSEDRRVAAIESL